MKNELSNFKEILTKYLHLSGIRILLCLKDGSKVPLENAVIKQDHVFNNYYEDFIGRPIALKSIDYAELYTE